MESSPPTSIGTSVFFGSNYKIAQLVDKYSILDKIVCERRSYNPDIYNYSKLYDRELILVEKLADLVLLGNSQFDVGISCGSGLIFKKRHTQLFNKGIWNLHYGPLPEVRGRHPISWGFLENLEFGVTIHQIDEAIDKGVLLAKAFVERDLNDTQDDIEQKIEEKLLEGLFHQAIVNWHEGQTRVLPEGKYYESLANKFNSINPNDYSAKFLFNLFKSQYKFGGVVINDQNYTQCSFYNENFPKLYEDCVIFTCQDGVLIALN